MKILHNVSKFETLEEIANKYNADILSIKKINNINSNVLPKQIEIPVSSEEFYVVKNLKRNLVIVASDDFEFIKSTLSKMGFKTKSKNAEDGVKVLFTKTDSEIYVVGVLETLHSICNKFNLKIEDIKKKNNLTSDKLFIGQMLKL